MRTGLFGAAQTQLWASRTLNPPPPLWLDLRSAGWSR
jgi:hypothetical protein